MRSRAGFTKHSGLIAAVHLPRRKAQQGTWRLDTYAILYYIIYVWTRPVAHTPELGVHVAHHVVCQIVAHIEVLHLKSTKPRE